MIEGGERERDQGREGGGRERDRGEERGRGIEGEGERDRGEERGIEGRREGEGGRQQLGHYSMIWSRVAACRGTAKYFCDIFSFTHFLQED